jgi:hypothetical protein
MSIVSSDCGEIVPVEAADRVEQAERQPSS